MSTKTQREKRKRRFTDAKEVAADRDKGFVSKAYKVPDGTSVFRWAKAKTYKLDIVSYDVGKGNPMADEGMSHFERTFYTHRDVGPGKDTVLCNAKSLGKKCPICEHREKLLMDPESDKKLTDSLKYKERQLMLVKDYDELEKGWQILDTANYKSFGELLDSKCKAGDDDQPYHKFHHPVGGMTLKVLVEEDTFNGKKYFKPNNIEMIPRKKDISDEVLDELPCLDDLLVEADYKELKKSFLQVPEDDEDDNEDEENEGAEAEEEDEEEKKPNKKPVKTGGKKPEDDSESDDEDSEDDESEEDDSENEEIEFSVGDEVKGEYKDKTFTGKVIKLVNGLVQVETTKGNLRTMDPDDLTMVKKASKAKAKEADEDEEEGEDDEEEKPKPSGKKPKPSSPTRSKKEKDDEDEDIPFDEDENEDED